MSKKIVDGYFCHEYVICNVSFYLFLIEIPNERCENSYIDIDKFLAWLDIKLCLKNFEVFGCLYPSFFKKMLLLFLI